MVLLAHFQALASLKVEDSKNENFLYGMFNKNVNQNNCKACPEELLTKLFVNS